MRIPSRMKLRHTIRKKTASILEKIVQRHKEVMKSRIKELVRDGVEENLNKLLETEAEKLTQAVRYQDNE